MKIFSVLEIRDIVISLLVLCIIFSYPDFLTQPSFFLVSLLAVGVAFIGHELSHKFAAIRQGFWSEYRMWPQGLFMALLFAMASGGTFFFAAPGAVYFEGSRFKRPSRKQLAKIGMAGVSFNVALMWLSVAASLTSGIYLFSYMASVNGWLAIFNLIPVAGLDGQKLLKLDRNTWLLLVLLSVSGFILSRFI